VDAKEGIHKNPAGGVNPERVARRARRQGVLSFGYFDSHSAVVKLFFAQAKKSDSLNSEALSESF